MHPLQKDYFKSNTKQSRRYDQFLYNLSSLLLVLYK